MKEPDSSFSGHTSFPFRLIYLKPVWFCVYVSCELQGVELKVQVSPVGSTEFYSEVKQPATPGCAQLPSFLKSSKDDWCPPPGQQEAFSRTSCPHPFLNSYCCLKPHLFIIREREEYVSILAPALACPWGSDRICPQLQTLRVPPVYIQYIPL